MESHVRRTQENKNQFLANSLTQKKDKINQGVSFVDNRTETVTQLKPLETVNNALDRQHTLQKKENNTGLPNNLKSGIEQLSGYSMDDVRVHYNSDKPAQLQAHAYAQGTDIHLGQGQEKHLGHEAWHIVQQKQGRVTPTAQLKGSVQVNQSPGLEKEADTMGQRALQMKPASPTKLKKVVPGSAVAQLRNKTEIVYQSGNLKWATKNDESNIKSQPVGLHTTAFIDPEDPVKGERTGGGDGIYGGDGSGTYKGQNSGRTLIQGHLLNANLGGKAQSYNLFPITTDMNKAHSTQVEELVKTLVVMVKDMRTTELAGLQGFAKEMLHVGGLPPAIKAAIAGNWPAYKAANPTSAAVIAAELAYQTGYNNTRKALDSATGKTYTSAEGGVTAGLPGAKGVPTGTDEAVDAADRSIAAGSGVGIKPEEIKTDAGDAGIRAAGKVATGLGANPTNDIAMAVATGPGVPVPAKPILNWDNTRVYYDIQVKSNGIDGTNLKPNNLRQEKFICNAYITTNDGISKSGRGSNISRVVEAPFDSNAQLAELGFEPRTSPDTKLKIGTAKPGTAPGMPTQHDVEDAGGTAVGHATIFKHT